MGGLASLRFVGAKCHPQARRLIGEYDVADGQSTPGLVNYQVAGNYTETGDVWGRRGSILRCPCAYEMAAVRSRGRSRGVIVDDGLRAHKRDGVRRDQRRGGRGEHRIAQYAGVVAVGFPPLADRPQIRFGVKLCHGSILA